MIIPPFAGVRLVEYRDRIELTPLYWCREFVGLGRMNAADVEPPAGPLSRVLFDSVIAGKEIWVIARWQRFEDGREEAINLNYLDPEATEEQAKKALDNMVDFAKMTRADLEALSKCFAATEEDLAYIENRFPNVSVPISIQERDVYQARLKVLAGLLPKTAALVFQADSTTDPIAREKIEREAVQAYFADLAHHWTDEQIKEWQRSNPIGSEWMCRFADTLNGPKRAIDPIDHELALNWLRQKYDLLTPEELSKAIKAATGHDVSPQTIKKRRQRLGLTTSRRPGPDPKSKE